MILLHEEHREIKWFAVQEKMLCRFYQVHRLTASPGRGGMLRRELVRTEEARRKNTGLPPRRDPLFMLQEGEKLWTSRGLIC